MILREPKEKFLKSIFSKGLPSQSFLVTGRDGIREEISDILVKFLRCRDKTFCKKCPECLSEVDADFRIYEGGLLGAKEAREIHALASQSAFSGKKIFLIRNDVIGPEAQATLLKTLEEPSEGTYFIISASSEEKLLSPLSSRLMPLHSLRQGEEKKQKHQRRAGIKSELTAAGAASKDRKSTEDFLDKMELWAEEKLKNAEERDLPKIAAFIEDLFSTKQRFYAKTYFSKMLLEHMIISKSYLN